VDASFEPFVNFLSFSDALVPRILSFSNIIIFLLILKEFWYEKNWPKFALFLIIALAFLIRIPGLASFPTGFTADEVAQGYTAYSILKTGSDEWVNFYQ